LSLKRTTDKICFRDNYYSPVFLMYSIFVLFRLSDLNFVLLHVLCYVLFPVQFPFLILITIILSFCIGIRVYISYCEIIMNTGVTVNSLQQLPRSRFRVKPGFHYPSTRAVNTGR